MVAGHTKMTYGSLPSRGAQSPGRERCENSKAGPGLRGDSGNCPLPLPLGWKGRYSIEDLPLAFQTGGVYICKGSEVGKGKLNSGRI